MILFLQELARRFLGADKVGLQVQRIATSQLIYRERESTAHHAVMNRLEALETMLAGRLDELQRRDEGEALQQALQAEAMLVREVIGQGVATLENSLVRLEQNFAVGLVEARRRHQKTMDWLQGLATMIAAQRDQMGAVRIALEQQDRNAKEHDRYTKNLLTAVRQVEAINEGHNRKLLEWVQAVVGGHDQDRKTLAALAQSLGETRTGVLETNARSRKLLEWLQTVAAGRDQDRNTLAGLSQSLGETRNGVLETNVRTQKMIDWQASIGQIIGDLKVRGRTQLSAEIAAMGEKMEADALARARLMNDLNRRYETLTAEILASLRQLLGETTPSPANGSDAPPADRTFGLSGPSPDSEVEGLLSLGRFLQNEPVAAGAISSITGAAIRRLFPAGVLQRRTIEARSGLKLQVDASDIYAAGAVFGRIQEADDFAIFMALIEPGARIVDVGANFGLYAAHAALYAGQNGKVFAFEPAPDTYELLHQNLHNNGLEAICCTSEAAVAAESGDRTFFVAADSAFSGLSDNGRSPLARTLSRPVVSLDTFAALQAEAEIDLLKIDVEGFEYAVLAGARELIARSPSVLIMMEFCYKNLTEERRAKIIEELEALEERGFAIHTLRPGEVGLDISALKAANLPQNLNQNLFICAPGGETWKRLRAAAATRVAPTPNPDEAAALTLLKRVISKS